MKDEKLLKSCVLVSQISAMQYPLQNLQNLWVTIYNFIYKYINNEGFPGSSAIKNPPAMQETQEMWVRSLGWEDPLEESMATHSSILAWRIPWTEEPGRLQSMWSQRVGHD